MNKLCKSYLVLLGFIVCVTIRSYGESSTCLMVYKEGGAPAVFQSPKCPLWKLSNYASHPRTARCQSATHQGRRNSQEDRTLCVLDLRIPFPGPAGVTEVTVGIMAVFDGHNGAEASEMASKLLLEYFMLHTFFLLDTTFLFLSKKSMRRLPHNGEHDIIFQAFNWDYILDWRVSDHGRFELSPSAIFGGSFHLEILKESLLRAIRDIDATFSKEASRDNLDSGSTATVILIADDQILVANVGDSKALLCSEEFQSVSEAKATLLRLYRQRRHNGAIPPIKYNDGSKLAVSNGLAHFSAKELTTDHHPDRDDERSRVESAGGHVLEWGGVSRVNGQLAVSRAIGDISFKSYGVISAPELTDWQPLTSNDSYLVVASDGIFEKLSPQGVCDLLWEFHNNGTVRSDLSASCSYSLADCIVNSALEKGSIDNMAAVVVPLRSAGFSQTLLKERLDRGDSDWLAFGVQKFIEKEPDLEHAHPIVAKFDRLLVEGKHGTVGCFYLSENLNENVDYTFWAQKVDHQDMYDLPQALPDALDHHYGGPLNLYNDQNMCLQFGMTVNGDNDKCINPEGFAGFLGFLESIPIHDNGSDYGSAEHAMPDSRYILKKRFGRGAFGEVWLAFNWNCTEGSNASNGGLKNGKCSFNTIHLDNYDRNSQANSSARDFYYGAPDDDLFILKRIMLMALKSCHDRNITHRDIKPENMVICFEDQDSGRCLKGIPSGDKKYTTKMRIIDFGSAMDVFTMKHLYGSVGPSRAEQTYEYTPPEALLNASWYKGQMQTTLKYDMWSAGVVFLELILGSPDVFQISALTRVLLDQHLEGWNDGLKELAHKLRSFMELCILIPGSSSKNHRISGTKGGAAFSPASWKCSEEYFSQQIKSRDPLKIGFPNVWALRLVRQLLVWDPDERSSVDEALQHPYFQPQPKG
ncbi:probable protein phosphatase 2C 51 isoform X7 [Camellia sinensis]|uniref:probable protein phosphatase 2C 51 isoform X7 n=1 Tax=Camellia sinensis TaxID=4442 RepID=UPI001035F4DC|nr:probable protein phosphatase 2C 51 isoform X7 [Camellia sinensis]